MRTQPLFALFAAALICPLSTAPAHAQRARVFVASYGADSATCGTFGAPCRTFQQAVTNVAAGGEVTAIDSAGFQPVTINKAVTITSPPGVEAGIAATPGGTAIIISAGLNDAVTLRGLTLEGGGTGGSVGIQWNSGAVLNVVDCVIRDYANVGIDAASGASNPRLTVSNTQVMGNPTGINVSSPGNSFVNASIDHTIVTGSSSFGINVSAASVTSPNIVGIYFSTISHNDTGVKAAAVGGLPTVEVTFHEDTFIDCNTAAIVVGNESTVNLSHVTENNSGFSVKIVSTGVALSDGTNHLEGSVTGGTLGTYPFQ